MRTQGRVSLWFCLATALIPAGGTAQTTQVEPLDARSLALGGAYTAVAQGPTAVWWNPGALGIQRGLELMPWSSRSSGQRGTDGGPALEHYGGAGACGSGAVGFGVQGTRFEANFGEETSWYLGLGTNLLRTVRPAPAGVVWGLGAAFKSTATKRSARSGSFEGSVSDQAWDMDLGTLVKVDFPVQLDGGREHGTISCAIGITMHSIFANDLELNTPVELPRTLRFGLAVDARLKEVHPGRHELGILFAIDVNHLRRALAPSDPEIGYGLEVRIWDIAALRLALVDISSPFTTSQFEMGFGLGTGMVRVGEQTFRFDFDLASLETSGERAEQFTLRGAWMF